MQKKGAMDLQEKNQVLFQQAIVQEGIENAFFALDNEWNFAYIDLRGISFFNRKSGDLKGKNIWKEFPFLIDKPIYQNFQKAIRRNRPVRFEEYHPEFRSWFEITAYPKISGLEIHIYNLNNLKKLAKQNEDMLSKVQLSDTLSEEIESQLRFLINSVNYPAAYINKESCYTFSNNSYVTFLGRNPLGKTPAMMHEKKLYTIFKKGLDAALKGKKFKLEIELNMNNNSRYTILHIPDIESGQVKGLVELIIPLKEAE